MVIFLDRKRSLRIKSLMLNLTIPLLIMIFVLGSPTSGWSSLIRAFVLFIYAVFAVFMNLWSFRKIRFIDLEKLDVVNIGSAAALMIFGIYSFNNEFDFSIPLVSMFIGSVSIFYFVMLRKKNIQSKIEKIGDQLCIKLSDSKIYKIDIPFIDSIYMRNDELHVVMSEDDPVIIDIFEFDYPSDLVDLINSLRNQ